MIKLKQFTVLAISCFAFSSQAQKVVETSKAMGFGAKITRTSVGMIPVGYMGMKEVFLSGNTYKVFEGTKQVNKDFLEEDFDRTDGRDLYFTEDEVIVVRADNKKDNAPILIQAFDDQLKPKGPIKQVGELSLTLNPAARGTFFSIGKRKIIIKISRNKNSGNTLIYCHVGNYATALNGEVSKKSSSTPYVKLILLDKDLNVINTFAQDATDDGNEIDLTSPTMLENGDAIALLTLKKVSVITIVDNQIISQALVHLTKDKETVLTNVSAELNSVLSYQTSMNSGNDKVVVSILSRPNRDYKNCALSIYTYDLKTRSLNKSITNINKEDFKMKSFKDFYGFQIIETRMFDDGSSMVILNSIKNIYDDGVLQGTLSKALLFVKLSPTGAMSWITPIEKSDQSDYRQHDMNEILTYVNKNGELDVVFNVPIAYYKKGTYKLKSWKALNGRAITAGRGGTRNVAVKVTLNLASGSSKIEKIDFGKKPVSSMYVRDSKALDNPGEYIIRVMYAGKPTIAHLDFNK